MNGDGLPDIAAIGFVTGDLAWFQHPGNAAARWTKHPVKSGWPSVNQVVIADLDGDGRHDLAAIADYGASELRWWRNAGPVDSAPSP
jgi:hypothetical protein